MFGFEWEPFRLTWGDAAAWMQAVFSVLAIAAAIWISQRDKAAAATARMNERRDRIGLILKYSENCTRIMAQAYLCIERVRNGEQAPPTSYVMDELELLEQMADKIDIYDIPSSFVIDLMVKQRLTMRKAHSILGAVQPLEKPNETTTSVLDARLALMKELSDVVDVTRRHLHEIHSGMGPVD